MDRDATPPDHRRADLPTPCELPRIRPDRPAPPRALGRRRLPGPSEGRCDPDRRPHRRPCRCLRRARPRPAVPRGGFRGICDRRDRRRRRPPLRSRPRRTIRGDRGAKRPRRDRRPVADRLPGRAASLQSAMTLADVLTLALGVAYLSVLVIAVGEYRRRREPISLAVVAVFFAVFVLFAVTGLGRLLPELRMVTASSAFAAFLALPVLTLNLVRHFEAIPDWLIRASTAFAVLLGLGAILVAWRGPAEAGTGTIL